LFPRIIATWKRKNKTPKMHYSEPTPQAITSTQRRKHNPRVWSLPPCPPNMDLMIEAKDKEQAVFELMRTFKLPGYNTFNELVPHTRKDDNKPQPVPKRKKSRAKRAKKGEEAAEDDIEEEEPAQQVIPDEELGMGGPEGRVYWPPGMEEWLRPKKRIIAKKEPAAGEDGGTLVKGKNKGRKAAADAAADAAKLAAQVAVGNETAQDTVVIDGSAAAPPPAKAPKVNGGENKNAAVKASAEAAQRKRAATATAPKAKAKASKAPKQAAKKPVVDDEKMTEEDSEAMSDSEEIGEKDMPARKKAGGGAKAPNGKTPRRQSRAKVNYAEDEVTEMSE